MKPQLFNGAHYSRQAIDLGGARKTEGGNSQIDLIKRAKKEREEREEKRTQERASVRIQAFYRGRDSAFKVRVELRKQFDLILASSSTIDFTSIYTATKLLAAFFVDKNTLDVKRLAAWCRAVLGSKSATERTPLLFYFYNSSDAISWNVLIRRISLLLLTQSSLHPGLAQAPLFLELLKMVCDPASCTKWKVIIRGKTPLYYLLMRGFYTHLRTLLLSLPATTRSHPCLSATIALTLLPLKAYPASTLILDAPKSSPLPPNSPERTSVLTEFTLSILTIPLLPQRIPLASLTSLASMPSDSIYLNMTSILLMEKNLKGLISQEAGHLLANLLAFGGQKIVNFSSKVLDAYLKSIKMLLDLIPVASLAEAKVLEEGKGKGKAIEVMVIDDSDEEEDDEIVERARQKVGTSKNTIDSEGDFNMSGGPPATFPSTDTVPIVKFDPRTLTYIYSLYTPAVLTPILSLSTRYSSSTRPALASFLNSLLQSCPSKREVVLNTIMYGSGSPGERGGGLLRELWRGFIRAGPLGKSLGSGEKSSSSIINSLSDTQLQGDWAMLILLSELFKKTLLTLGDDEFHSSKNPLSLDEVVGLSGLLRNLVFALYWQEGVFLGGRDGERFVVGSRMPVESLRTLATALLQQIHARDSRTSFCPPDHWLMTSEFDLNSFVQTVVLEDQRLDENATEEVAEDEDGTSNPSRIRPAIVEANLTKRQMAFVSPRLGVLNNIPFVIPFETRVAIFRQFVSNDRHRLQLDRAFYHRPEVYKIRRNHISEDAYAHLNGLGPKIKGRIAIAFIDEFGEPESGIDGGGLYKELLTSLSKEAFDTDRGLWLATAQQELYPSPSSYSRESTQLSWYSFLGRILGKALYDGILIDVRFAGFFLSKWLGRQSYLDDLASLDPELYNGLLFLKNMVGDVESELMLNFSVTEDDFGASRTIDLIPNGSEISVTNENRIQYIYLISNYRLNSQIQPQCTAFFEGLSEVIPERFLRMFNQAELRMLVGGVDAPIDVADLKANTVYGEFPGDDTDETIINFWSVVEEFDKDERSKLVKFVTSCARPPLLGFSEMYPKFAIRRAGTDETRLPTSSTCVNLLKLPPYKDRETLKSKLLYALNSGAGFDLS